MYSCCCSCRARVRRRSLSVNATVVAARPTARRRVTRASQRIQLCVKIYKHYFILDKNKIMLKIKGYYPLPLQRHNSHWQTPPEARRLCFPFLALPLSPPSSSFSSLAAFEQLLLLKIFLNTFTCPWKFLFHFYFFIDIGFFIEFILRSKNPTRFWTIEDTIGNTTKTSSEANDRHRDYQQCASGRQRRWMTGDAVGDTPGRAHFRWWSW